MSRFLEDAAAAAPANLLTDAKWKGVSKIVPVTVDSEGAKPGFTLEQ